MASIRLYESQITYLRSKAGADTLHSALARFKNGELVTEKRDFAKRNERLLPYSLHRPLKGVDAKQVRAVLFASMRNPVNFANRIKVFDDEIESWFNSLGQAEYIERGE